MSKQRIIEVLASLSTAVLIVMLAACDGDMIGPDNDTTQPGRINDLHIDSTSQGTVYLSWTAPGDDAFDGKADCYDFRYATDPADLLGWYSATTYVPAVETWKPAPAGSKETLELGGLSPDSTYCFAIRTSDEAGNISQMSNIAAALPFGDIVVTFPDTALLSVIRNTLRQPEGDIYYSDLLTLSYLPGENRGIYDLTGMSYLGNLKSLRLWRNYINDLTPLSNLRHLKNLLLSSNHIIDLTPLAGLANLEGLELQYNAIIDLTALSGLVNLESVFLNANRVRDLSPLSDLPNLRTVLLDDNMISDLTPVSRMSNLEVLYLDGNPINDLTPLSDMTHLVVLGVERAEISDLAPLSGLISLKYLDISDNEINSMDALTGLVNLERLNASFNQISDISCLTMLTNLKILYLRSNEITDISPLIDNEGIGFGDKVYLKDNPLSETSINEYIPALEERGVEVSY